MAPDGTHAIVKTEFLGADYCELTGGPPESTLFASWIFIYGPCDAVDYAEAILGLAHHPLDGSGEYFATWDEAKRGHAPNIEKLLAHERGAGRMMSLVTTAEAAADGSRFAEKPEWPWNRQGPLM